MCLYTGFALDRTPIQSAAHSILAFLATGNGLAIDFGTPAAIFGLTRSTFASNCAGGGDDGCFGRMLSIACSCSGTSVDDAALKARILTPQTNSAPHDGHTRRQASSMLSSRTPDTRAPRS